MGIFTATQAVRALEYAGLKVETKYAQKSSYVPGTYLPTGLILHHDAAGLNYVDDWDGEDNVDIARLMSSPTGTGAQFWVGRSGTWYLLCRDNNDVVGPKWHAGSGEGYGTIRPDLGNEDSVGVETDYGPVRPGWSGPTVTSAEYTWPVWDKKHLDSIYLGTRALCQEFGLKTACGHKEYTPTRKIDPANVDLDNWRGFINSSPKPPAPKPDPNSPDWSDMASKAEIQQVFHEELSKFFGTNPDQKTPVVRIGTRSEKKDPTTGKFKEVAADATLSEALQGAATNSVRAYLASQ